MSDALRRAWRIGVLVAALGLAACGEEPEAAPVAEAKPASVLDDPDDLDARLDASLKCSLAALEARDLGRNGMGRLVVEAGRWEELKRDAISAAPDEYVEYREKREFPDANGRAMDALHAMGYVALNEYEEDRTRLRAKALAAYYQSLAAEDGHCDLDDDILKFIRKDVAGDADE